MGFLTNKYESILLQACPGPCCTFICSGLKGCGFLAMQSVKSDNLSAALADPVWSGCFKTATASQVQKLNFALVPRVDAISW